MTNIGRDELARQRAVDVAEAIAKRGGIIRQEHTREVRDVPPEIMARLEALEGFAQTVADKINRLELLIYELQQETSKRALKDHTHDFSTVVRVA